MKINKQYSFGRNALNVLVSLILLTSCKLLGQQQLPPERPDDPQILVDRSQMQRTSAWSQRSADLLTTQVNVDENGENIAGDAANEPSIAIDPTNPDRIVIGWRQFDTVESNFRQAGYGYSQDGGETFIFPGVLDPGLFRSDPVLDFDSQGNFYYNSLQGDFSCDVFRITDGGVVWSDPVPANGGDKQWMRIDRSGGIGQGNNYSYWNVSFTTCEPGDFTRSVDGAQSFESCIAVAESPRWGTLAVGPDGTLHLIGAIFNGEIKLISSSNAQNPKSDIVWDQVTTVDLDGFLAVGGQVNPAGLMGQAWVDVDQNNGNIYVVASVNREDSTGDPGDVMFARSTDGGLSFEPPVRLNTDAGNNAYQWFGTMSVAPNGRIDVVWLDTRDAAGQSDSVLYYTFSEDGGDSWEPEEPISPEFNPNIGYPQQNKMGDYFDMVSDNDAAHLAWVNTLSGGQDVYYSRISPELLQLDSVLPGLSSLDIYPNPFSGQLRIDVKLQDQHQVGIRIYNLLGQEVAKLADGQSSGLEKYTWDASGQVAGLYLIEIDIDGVKEVRKVLLK